MDGLELKVDGLERKVDAGFTEVRGEFVAVRGEMRENFHTLLAILLTMLIAMILGFAAIVLQQIL